MKAALRGSYVEVVFYMGTNENYPDWFCEELYNNVHCDADRYTFYIPPEERRASYHERQLVEDYSVFLRKADGRVHLTDFDAFDGLYYQFRFDRFDNSGLAAMHDDVIDYVECQGGNVHSGYPDWFYEYSTEAINLGDETIFIDSSNRDISIRSHCVFLRNKFGEIRIVDYQEFMRHYDPSPGL